MAFDKKEKRDRRHPRPAEIPGFPRKLMKLGFGSEKKPNVNHGDVVSYLRNRKEGWKFAAVALGVVSCILAFALVESSGKQNTVLLPYHISTAAGSMPYNVNNLGESQQYLGILARSDLANLTIWDPATVQAQFGRFLARCTPQAYQKWQFKLPKLAKQMVSDDISEMFFYQSEKFIPPYSVEVTGLLKRYMGKDLLFKRPVQYVLSYAPNNGIFSIANVTAQVEGQPLPKKVLQGNAPQ